MRKILLMMAIALSIAFTGAQAQDKMGKMAPGKMGKMDATKKGGDAKAGATTTISGFAKGSPAGKTFVLASNKGATTVDTSKGVVRFKGKFFSVSKITGGSVVKATGVMNGKTLMAKEVVVSKVGGDKAPSGAGMSPPPVGGDPKAPKKK